MSKSKSNIDYEQILKKNGFKFEDIKEKDLISLFILYRQERDDYNLYKFLIDNGANLNDPDRKYFTVIPLINAIQYNVNQKIIELIFENTDRIHYYDALIILCNKYDDSQYEFVKKLIDKTINKEVNLKSKYNDYNLLIQSVNVNNNYKIFKYLIKKGINVNDKNSDNNTVLDLALLSRQDEKKIKILIKNGAKMSDNILEKAYISENIEFYGMDVDDEDMIEYSDIIEKLRLIIRYGGNINKFLKYLKNNITDVKEGFIDSFIEMLNPLRKRNFGTTTINLILTLQKLEKEKEQKVEEKDKVSKIVADYFGVKKIDDKDKVKNIKRYLLEKDFKTPSFHEKDFMTEFSLNSSSDKSNNKKRKEYTRST